MHVSTKPVRPAIAALAAVCLMAATAPVSLAHPGGGGGMRGGGFGGGMSGMHGNFGGQSGAHISRQGMANSNGPNSSDRDFGRNRAQDRMSAQGLAHSKAHAAHSSHHSHHARTAQR